MLKDQRRLSKFFEKNVGSLGGQSGEVALYMLAVIVRIYDQVPGRMRKVSGAVIDEASARVNGVTASLLPFDEGFPGRVRGVDWRAQPHILDEALWALFEREEKEEGEEPKPAVEETPVKEATTPVEGEKQNAPKQEEPAETEDEAKAAATETPAPVKKSEADKEPTAKKEPAEPATLQVPENPIRKSKKSQ